MRPTIGLRMFRQTPRLMAPAKPGGTGIMDKMRKVPPELWPLGAVVGFAVVAATYSSIRKFLVDKNLRLARQGARHEAPSGDHH